MLFLQNLTSATLIDVQEYNYAHFDKRVSGLNYNALSYRIRSDATIGFSGKSVSAGDRSVTFFPKGLEYTRRCTHDRMLVIHFEGDGISSREIECVYPKNESISQLFEQIVGVWGRKEQGYYLHAGALLYQLLYLLEKEFGKRTHYPPLLENAIEVISHRYCDAQLTVESIANELNISEVYLRRLFADNVGKSPKQYITDLRIDKAKSILTQCDNSIEYTAAVSGFNDSKNFTVTFKKSAGITPTDYKKKYSSYI